jgi:hypothetical protein
MSGVGCGIWRRRRLFRYVIRFLVTCLLVEANGGSVQICCSDGTVSTKVGVGHYDYEQVMYLCEIIH